MNAAIKAIFPEYAVSAKFSKKLLGSYPLLRLSLIILVIISAFAVVYERSFYRVTLAEYQQLQKQGQDLNLQMQQLQLENSVWANQSRVQAIAETQLAMHKPNSSQSTLVKL